MLTTNRLLTLFWRCSAPAPVTARAESTAFRSNWSAYWNHKTDRTVVRNAPGQIE